MKPTPQSDAADAGRQAALPSWRLVARISSAPRARDGGANRGLLSECGVPAAVADSDRRWMYVLLHGDDSRHRLGRLLGLTRSGDSTRGPIAR